LKVFERLSQERRLQQQAAELRALRKQVEQLRIANERMRDGMRRCTTCEYRLEVIASR